MNASFTSIFEEDRGVRWKHSALALVIALFVHIVLVFLLPEKLIPAHRVAEEAEPIIYEFNLAEPEEMRFVEANPDAPINEPDRTDQYSFRAQQAADDNPLADSSNRPTIDGNENSQKILQGVLERAPAVPPGVYSPEANQGEGEGTEGGKLGRESTAVATPSRPRPAPDFIRQKPVSTDGPGSRADISGQSPELVEDLRSEEPLDVYRPQQAVERSVQQGDGEGGVPEARPMPRARPRLAPELLTGPLMQSRSSARLRGELAIDATFSEFGEYQQQLYAAIQTGWYQEIEFHQPLDTAARVHVRFLIRADGTVDQVDAVQTTAGKLATLICENAIIKRSPFRPWTREMVEVFGEERWLNVVFHYR